MDRLAAMQNFIQISDAKSLSAAARTSGRSLASTVRSLAALESHLGVRLIERTTRRMRLTDEGLHYLERARAIVRIADEADASISERSGRASGQLSVSAPMVFGRLHVAPAIFQLTDREADLIVRLHLTDRVVNLVEEGFDAAVRIGRLPNSALRAIEIGQTRWLYCASPGYLKRRGVPRTESALAHHSCPHLIHEALPHPTSARFACNSVDVLVQAALSGNGIVRVLSYQVADHLRGGRLREVLPGLASTFIPISIVFAHPHLMSARLTAFRDAMLSLRGRLDFVSDRGRTNKTRSLRHSP
ncbi:MAG: LysR substrate-binding domain-containing protein [Gammaproteobacteria bacterium]